ncbi:MAG: cupin domain-containing protein [Bacteroidetes bacterium]|jgi:predicted cupin superfamily sugar epimerase|nr:cupin domain-containing protein [Bacteroidota bacterium]
MTIDFWIEKLALLPHPEGGFYKEMYRSEEEIPAVALPNRFKGNRSFSTAIYYLLGRHDFSAFHRIHADETWHFYDGKPLQLLLLHPDGRLEEVMLGVGENCRPMFTVKSGLWFAAKSSDTFSLCGCTVAPGFDFADFEMAAAESLSKEFPQHRSIIESFTRS